MSGGGESSDNKKSTSSSDPWGAQQPYIKDMFSNAAQQYDQSQNSSLPSTQVSPNQNIIQGQQGTLNFANTGGQDISNTAVQGYGDLMGTLDVANSPLVQSQITQANSQVADDFNRLIMPSISNDALGAGQFGGSRQGVAEGLAAEGAADAMANQSTNIMADAFRTGSGNAQFAMGNAPSVWNMGNMANQAQGQVGQDQAAWEQAALDDQLAQWYWQQQRPWDLLGQYQGLVGGNYGGSATSKAGG